MKTFLKILGIVVFAVVVILVIFFIIKGTKTNNPSPSSTDTQTSITVGTSPDTSTDLTFSDSVHHVNFQYPSDMALQSFTNGSGSPSWSANSSTGGTLISDVVLDKSFEPNTNFQEVKFTVGSSTDVTAIAQCANAQNGEVAQGTTSINGVFFSKFSLGDAGAGNFYDTTSYRTIYNNECYAVEYTIHTTNIGNYDPSQGISNYNKTPITTLLESVAQSFKFLK